jgi:hypothetical protein
LGRDDRSIRYNMGKEGWPVATREELKQLIDGMPDEALPFIQETLKRWTPERSAAAARLIARLSKGYDFGLQGERPYGTRDDLYDR